jgi:hypothetical protein
MSAEIIKFPKQSFTPAEDAEALQLLRLARSCRGKITKYEFAATWPHAKSRAGRDFREAMRRVLFD